MIEPDLLGTAKSRSRLFSMLSMPGASRTVLVVGALVMGVLGFSLFIEQIYRPPCCDAHQYLELAKRFNLEGITLVKEPLRTFAYPWFLSLVLAIANSLNLPEGFLIFVCQILLYYLSVRFISRIAHDYSRKLGAVVYLALCFNFFVLPYVGITLTDSVYTSLAILLLGVIMRIEVLAYTEDQLGLKWVLGMTILLGILIAVRPAAIWLVVPVFYCLTRLLWKGKVNLVDSLLAVIIGAFPLYVQIVLNVIQFKRLTFFPASDLGGMQVRYGIENIKYGTWLGGGPAQNFYPAGRLIETTSQTLDMSWYAENPGAGLKLLLLKLVGAFDFDFVMPYPYHKAANKWAASFVSFSLLWFGFVGVVIHGLRNSLVVLGSRFLPLVVCLAWCSVNLLSAPELRFTLPLLTYLIVVSCVVLSHMIVEKDRIGLVATALGWAIAMPVLYSLAKTIRSQSAVLNITGAM